MPVAEVARQTTGLAKVAGILLMILGAIVVVVGILFLLGAVVARDLGTAAGTTEFGDFVGSVVAVFAIIFLIIGIVEVVGGVGTVRGSGWGRVIGLVYGVFGTLIGLSALAGSRSAAASNGSAATGIVILVVYAFITIVLAVRWKTPVR